MAAEYFTPLIEFTPATNSTAFSQPLLSSTEAMPVELEFIGPATDEVGPGPTTTLVLPVPPAPPAPSVVSMSELQPYAANRVASPTEPNNLKLCIIIP